MTPTYEPLCELRFEPSRKEAQEPFDALVHFGGFPEPFLKQNERTLRRWHNERLDRLIKEDIRDIESVRDLSALQILSDLLPARVGSKLSLNALRGELQVAHKTVASWVDLLERFYYHFRVRPFTARQFRSLRKEAKLYLWDWSAVERPAARFENLVASHLLKFVHFLHDVEGYKAELCYLGDVEGREVDFLVAIDHKPWFAVEVKETDLTPSKSLGYFAERLQIPWLYQVVSTPRIDLRKGRVRVISAAEFCRGLV